MTATDQEPSACEKRCQSQQTALAACMNAIRDAREDEANRSPASRDFHDGEEVDIGKVDTSCLAPSVAAWTECCTRANNGSVEVNQGHIGI